MLWLRVAAGSVPPPAANLSRQTTEVGDGGYVGGLIGASPCRAGDSSRSERA
jgi:hypothetical protein